VPSNRKKITKKTASALEPKVGSKEEKSTQAPASTKGGKRGETVEVKESASQPISAEPRAEAAPVPPAGGGGEAKKPKLWVLGILVLVVGLVALEVTVLLKGKRDRFRKVTHIATLGQRGGPPDVGGKFWGPTYLRTDDRNYLYLVDINFNKILVWNMENGSHVMDLNRERAQKQNFAPSNVDADGEGNIFALDKNQGEITVFSPQGEFLRRWAVARPEKMTVSPAGDVYVTDRERREIVRYNAMGEEQGRLGHGKLLNPQQMDTDKEGKLYVLDHGHKKVMVFTPLGKNKGSWPVKFEPKEYSTIAVKPDKIYLTDQEKELIKVYTKQGKLLWDINAAAPVTLAVDNAGSIYMTSGGGVDQYTIDKKIKKE